MILTTLIAKQAGYTLQTTVSYHAYFVSLGVTICDKKNVIFDGYNVRYKRNVLEYSLKLQTGRYKSLYLLDQWMKDHYLLYTLPYIIETHDIFLCSRTIVIQNAPSTSDNTTVFTTL
mgnify:CR=1 FL=1